PAITVIIDEGSGRGPEQAVQTGLLADIGKGTVAVVEEEFQAAILGHENVRPAIIVDVANGHAHAVAGNIETGTSADVMKSAIHILAEKPVRGGRTRTAVLYEINIQPAVLI